MKSGETTFISTLMGQKTNKKNTIVQRYIYQDSKENQPYFIFRAEQVAIIMALEWIRESKLENSVIFCDSLSVLCDLQELNQSCLSNEIRHLLYMLKKQHLEVFFLWIPSHCGIFGNETVDGLAKDALEQENETEIAHNKSEINNIISNHYGNVAADLGKFAKGTLSVSPSTHH